MRGAFFTAESVRSDLLLIGKAFRNFRRCNLGLLLIAVILVVGVVKT